MSALLERMDAITPKKILSLDGGGIRGALTLGYLKKIEDILKAKHTDKPDFRMSDYFDLIGGTSTGAIIAALLAMGNSVDHITKLYMDLGDKIFATKRGWWNPKSWFATYGYEGMEEGLKLAYGEDTTIGSDRIKTGLCIVAKRADTNSIWPMINHPRGKYYDAINSKNKELLLWKVVRASTAAPTYFKPQMIEVDENKKQRAAFIDGGLSMANNPAVTLLMVATLKGFPFRWPMGEDKIFLVSVGTGIREFKKLAKEIDAAWLGTWAANIPEMLMQDASWQNQLFLQWLSQSHTAEEMDSEIGNMDGDMLSGKSLITYLRYNFKFTSKNLNALGFEKTFDEKDAVMIADMANPKNKELLYEIGYKASSSVKPEHFADF
ncbi:MAG: patatin [Bacteroidetes bacterium]|nr:MAG: patatin [Bacteroidota bacterium]